MSNIFFKIEKRTDYNVTLFCPHLRIIRSHRVRNHISKLEIKTSVWRFRHLVSTVLTKCLTLPLFATLALELQCKSKVQTPNRLCFE